MNRRRWEPLAVAVALAVSCLAGCNRRQESPPPPAPEVAVVTVEPRQVVLSSELPGRTTAYLVAEIRPQVNGLLKERLFKEGSQVKAGQDLYKIDPAPYQAAFDSASANLHGAREAVDRARAALGVSTASLKRHQATLALAQSNLDRYKKLAETRTASTMELDQAGTDVDVAEATLRTAEAQVECDREAVEGAEAAVKQAEAALETARINLGYTTITAPIAGRIGRSHVTEGAIVTAYQPAPLATIQKFDPIYVDVPQSTAELIRLRRSLADGHLKDNETDKVKIVLEDGTAYPLKGSLKFQDVTVDPTTGSVILRIEVPNPDGILLPGMFVRAVIDEGVHERAMLIPQQAVSRDPKGNPFVLIVDEAGEVVQRGLVIDRAVRDRWLVSSGLAKGERVIVEGMLKVAPGIVKRMQEVSPGWALKVVEYEAGGPSAAKPGGPAQTTAPPKPQ